MEHDTATHRSKLPLQLAALLLALLGLAWRAWPDAHLHIFFLDTPGDAILIQTPDGGYILIDGGADPAALTAAIGRRMPFWRHTLSAVLLTSPDAKHLPGQVAALARYRAEVALAAPGEKGSALLSEWRRLLDEQRTPIRRASAGQQIAIGGANLRILSASDGRAGLVFQISYGATSALFDYNGPEAGESLPASAARRRADLLAYPWQRDPRTTLVEGLRPRALVLTDGYATNRPIELSLRDRAVGGAALYHEALNGTIEWVSDGQRSWFNCER